MLCAFLFMPAAGQIPEKELLKIIGAQAWSEEERLAFENGDAVVRTLETGKKQEVASLGVIRLRGLPPVSMLTFRDCLNQKSSDQLKSGGRFSEPPEPGDLDDLRLDKDTVEQLQKCKLGSCDLNLSSEAIARFQTEVDWNAPEAGEHAEHIMREILVGYVRRYLELGDRGLGNYDNRRKTVDLAADHASLLSGSLLIEALAPEFLEFLKQYPGGTLGNVENSVHWSVVDFGLKPSMTVSHAAAYVQQKGDSEHLFVASKQIYASRYLDSSLTFTILLRVAGQSGIDSYLLFADRSRSDALEGALGGMARGIVKKESINRITSVLEKAQLRLIAATRPATVTSDDQTGLMERVGDLARSPATLLAFTVLVFGAIFLLWRRERR